MYHSLAQTRSTNIKQTLAYSLHEIARILDDGQVVEEELVAVFEDLIQEVETVQMGVIKFLAPFLAKLPALCRVSYLPILHEILHSTNPFNWRLRQHLAVQLPQLVALPTKPDVYRTLFPTMMTLLQDPVSSVRRETFKGISAFLNAVFEVVVNEGKIYTAEDVKNSTHNLEEITKAINNFVASDKCYLRQLWAELCLQLFKDIPKQLFEETFLPGLLVLTCDPIFNVRLAVAQFMVGWAPEYPAPWYEDEENGEVIIRDNSNSPWEWLLKRSDIKTCVERLSKDDQDIYLCLSQLQNVYLDIDFRIVSCRGQKTAPGGVKPIIVDSSSAPRLDPSLTFHLDATQMIHEKQRSRSNSNGSYLMRSMSLDASAAEERLHSRMHNKQLDDEDDDDDSNFKDVNTIEIDIATTEGPMITTIHPREHEYISSLITADAVEELDIIDGIIKSPSSISPGNKLPRDFEHKIRNTDGSDKDYHSRGSPNS